MPHSTDESIEPAEQWRRVLTNAHKRRLDAISIEGAIKELKAKANASSDEIVKIVLSLRLGRTADQDPLVIRYVEILLQQRCILPSSLLVELHQDSDYTKSDNLQSPANEILPTFEEKVFLLLREVLNNRIYPGSAWRLHGIVFGIVRWMSAITELETRQQLELGPLHTAKPQTVRLHEALGLLAYTVFGHPNFKDIERQPWWKERRSYIAAELLKYAINVLGWSQSPISQRLQAITGARPFLALDTRGRLILTREQIFSQTENLQPVLTRGAVFIWLTACICATVPVDDSTIRNFLLVRYHDDVQSAAMNLIISSFDILTNNAPVQGTPHIQMKARSFICNRLPILLASFTTLMPVGGIEACISLALTSIEPGPMVPLGSATVEVKELLRKTKIEFIQACILHSLMAESNATIVLPGVHIQTPKVSRYNKSSLLSQCLGNLTRLEVLCQELESMNGNLCAISGCIADLLTTLCSNKDTMSLKNACSILLKRITAMDLVFQCIAPATITIPLCHVLNDWSHDQDQTEYQPPYEEFAIILLFLVAIVHNYKLSRVDIGLTDNDSFVSKILFDSVSNASLSAMNEEQNKQLGSWIQGLYATDEHGETIGITDEVYSQCPPQAFYTLVPLLFEQTVLACKTKALTPSVMKGGLEFLLEPFLLPSLIRGLQWTASTSWSDSEDTNVRLFVLDKLLKSSNSSPEAQMMHKAILTIVARPLEASLRRLAAIRLDKQKEVNKCLDLLKPYLTQPREAESVLQLQTWVQAGLITSLRSTVASLVDWIADGAISPCPKYSPNLIWQAERLLTPGAALRAVIEEIQHQTELSRGSMALDVCTAMVCTPSSQHISTVDVNRIGLASALRLLIMDEDALVQMPVNTAKATIRLYRSVEAQASLSQLASQLDLANINLPAQETADQVMQDLGLTSTDSNLEATAAAIVSSGLDTSFDGSAFGMTNDELNRAAAQTVVSDADMLGIDQSNDIFGSLDMDLSGQGLLGTNANGESNPDDEIFGDLDMTNLW